MGQDDIANAIGQAREFLTANPAEARYRDGGATATVEDGLRVRVAGADGASLVTDMVTGIGGGGSAPSPGWIMRAAYASCVATFIVMRAAEQGIDMSDLTVTVDSESDDRGILDLEPSVPPGPLSVRIAVSASAGGVDEATIRDIVDHGIRHCPVHDAVARAVPVEVDIKVA